MSKTIRMLFVVVATGAFLSVNTAQAVWPFGESDASKAENW